MKHRSSHKFKFIFKYLKPWYFLVIFLLALTTSVVALRANNEHMAVLRAQVYAADKKGVNVQAALNKLQAYVTRHMNTNLSTGTNSVYPPIQLKYTYERLIAAQSKEFLAGNAQLYTKAQNYCQTVIPMGTSDFLGGPRVPCIENYVKSHGAKLAPISPALYQFDFISPTWSPDLAGWSIVVTTLSAIMLIVSFIYTKVTKLNAK